MSALLGTSLSGRYRLDQRVGTGGMSTVYRAFDSVLARPVAIKLMDREIARDSEQLERFRREARAVAQLSHPHIVTVIDYGEDQGRPYIVLEFVEGETLKARIRRTGGLPVAESVAYAIEITRALGCAHDHQIVHRDVKPQNVLIDPEGSAKVTDFGIARTLDEEGLTTDGRVLGTTDYVAPEQALGHDVTGQSDLYSLGIVLWEMLVGEAPFRGENQVAVAMQHVRAELPDVQLRRPEVSSSLAAVIDRATNKDLSRRYANADEFAADLEEVLALETARAGGTTGEATTVLRTIPSRARRRLPLRLRSPGLAVGLLLLALTGIAAAIVLLTQGAHRGPGASAARPPASGDHLVVVASSAAHDYDPFGSGAKGEHPEQTQFATDNQSNTEWTTETYEGGNLGKPGVGLYLDADPGTKAKVMRVRTSAPGFTASVYTADSGPPKALSGWRPVGGPVEMTRKTDISLHAGTTKHRYWLLWITKLASGQSQAKVAEVALYR